ncbi:hypothetical protein [Nonomuraea insulae]|uniref:Uncharacterized protein n=1 Tax=Nonomuraea insulae TaxID=1616787 RepID=A0ABW1D142_9ACTN
MRAETPMTVSAPAATAPVAGGTAEDPVTAPEDPAAAPEDPAVAPESPAAASEGPATAPPTGGLLASGRAVREACPGDGRQATSDNASAGLAATATLAPLAIPFNRTRNRSMSPVLTHFPTPSAEFTRSSTSDTPAAATGTEGTAARTSTPATTHPRRIVNISPAVTNYA